MKRSIFAGLALASALSLPGLAETAPTVKEIDVTMDMAAIENPEAASYWGQLETDLEEAILSRVTDSIADDGVSVLVDIREVELSNGIQEALNLADTRLVGQVNMTHDSDNTRFGAYELSVDVESARPLFPAGYDITVKNADTKVFYKAMVDAFAEAVVAGLK